MPIAHTSSYALRGASFGKLSRNTTLAGILIDKYANELKMNMGAKLVVEYAEGYGGGGGVCAHRYARDMHLTHIDT